ncbi:MAG TPA: cytochrome c [Gemmatimonadales bacterium]|jgi:mono/diheme cytochrome c family protein|nr:cytochrome c [Gemmatimonadales bacterium]
MSFERSRAVAGVLLGLAAAARPAPGQGTADTATRSVAAGVYTAVEARAGEAVFRRVCLECHATGQFHDAAFQRSWTGRTARELFELIRTQMPQDNPGRLRRDEYAAVLAYILELNGCPPSDTALGSDDAALRRVRLEFKPSAPPPPPNQ